MIRVGLIGDFDETVIAHQAIPLALELAGAAVGVEVAHSWMHTSTLERSFARDVSECDALWCVPASPYADGVAAQRAIRFARESQRPFLGTCAGFQYAMLEYADSIWHVRNPAHAETDPAAADPVIAELSCALVEEMGEVRFASDSRIARAYGEERSVEGYHCRYGLSPTFAPRLDRGPLRATAWDYDGDVRAVELDGHPFFVATLFQPERAALAGKAPPIVCALVEVALEES